MQSMRLLLWLLLLLVQCMSSHSTGAGRGNTRQLQQADDDPLQHGALLQIYTALNGNSWTAWQGLATSQSTAAQGKGPVAWNSSGVSYCRWLGVLCCRNSPLTLVDCDNSSSVVVLNLQGFGLQGSLPNGLGALQELTVLNLADNPQLSGSISPALSLPRLLWLSVEGTGTTGCKEREGACQLTDGLQQGPGLQNSSDVSLLRCPPVLLASFQSFTRQLPAALKSIITQPFSQRIPGAVISDGSFMRYAGCQCSGSGASPQLDSQGRPSCPGNDVTHDITGYQIGISLAAVLPVLLVALGIYVFVKYKSTLHELVRNKEQEMKRKRGKVPGTPGVALQNGRGILSLADVMVTWVCTDVADSTKLWEWNPEAMDRAIDLHNATIREMLDEFGGHEIRNEGDSFTLSFHDAIDGVKFCLKCQERLMGVDWPSELLLHSSGSMVTVGDVTGNPAARGAGARVMAGLRVRMGINTGVPDDIFLHDVTEHVDYRGDEYELAGEICDVASGGQILMGPKTFQRWNKSFGDAAMLDPLLGLVPEGWREGSQSFLAGARKSTAAGSSMLGLSALSFRSSMPRGTATQLALAGLWNASTSGFAGFFSTAGASPGPGAAEGRSHSGAQLRNSGGAEEGARAHSSSGVRSSMPFLGAASGSVMAGNMRGLLSFTLRGTRASPLSNIPRPSPGGGAPMFPYVPGDRGAMGPVSTSNALDNGVRSSGSLRRILLQAPVQQVLEAPPPVRIPAPPQSLSQSQQPVSPPSQQSPQQYGSPPSRSSLLSAAAPPRTSFQRRQLSIGGSDRNSGGDGAGPGPSSEAAAAAAAAAAADGASPRWSSARRMMSQLLRAASSPLNRAPPSPQQQQQQQQQQQEAGPGAAQPESPQPRRSTGNARPGTRLGRGPQPDSGSPGHDRTSPQDGPITRPMSLAVLPRFLTNGTSDAGSNGVAPTISSHINPLFQRQSALEVNGPQEQEAQERPTWEVDALGGQSTTVGDWSKAGGPSTTANPSANMPAGLADALAPQGSGDTATGERRQQLRPARSVRRLVSRCLACLHVITSGDDVGPWDPGADGGSRVMQRLASSYKDPSNIKGVIIDMGYYEWRTSSVPDDGQQQQQQNNASAAGNGRQRSGGQVADVEDAEAKAVPHAKRFVHLVQVLPTALAPRALMFDWPLAMGEQWDKISPGFFDAPGSNRLIFPGMRELMDPQEVATTRPIVSVAFSAVDGFKEVSAYNQEMAREMLQLHNACVRETLSSCGGYECKEFNGSFMVGFSDACSVLEWALTLQLALMHLPWQQELLQCDQAAEVWDPEARQMLFCGLRCRVGIYTGAIDRVTPHVKTGRADYFGQPVNRAARLMTAANPGQVVCDRSLIDTVLEEWQRRYNTEAAREPASPVHEEITRQGSATLPNDLRMARSFVGTSFSKRRLRALLASGNSQGGSTAHNSFQVARTSRGVSLPPSHAPSMTAPQERALPVTGPPPWLVSGHTSNRSAGGPSSPPSSAIFNNSLLGGGSRRDGGSRTSVGNLATTTATLDQSSGTLRTMPSGAGPGAAVSSSSVTHKRPPPLVVSGGELDALRSPSAPVMSPGSGSIASISRSPWNPSTHARGTSGMSTGGSGRARRISSCSTASTPAAPGAGAVSSSGAMLAGAPVTGRTGSVLSAKSGRSGRSGALMAASGSVGGGGGHTTSSGRVAVGSAFPSPLSTAHAAQSPGRGAASNAAPPWATTAFASGNASPQQSLPSPEITSIQRSSVAASLHNSELPERCSPVVAPASAATSVVAPSVFQSRHSASQRHSVSSVATTTHASLATAENSRWDLSNLRERDRDSPAPNSIGAQQGLAAALHVANGSTGSAGLLGRSSAAGATRSGPASGPASAGGDFSTGSVQPASSGLVASQSYGALPNPALASGRATPVRTSDVTSAVYTAGPSTPGALTRNPSYRTSTASTRALHRDNNLSIGSNLGSGMRSLIHSQSRTSGASAAAASAVASSPLDPNNSHALFPRLDRSPQVTGAMAAGMGAGSAWDGSTAGSAHMHFLPPPHILLPSASSGRTALVLASPTVSTTITGLDPDRPSSPRSNRSVPIALGYSNRESSHESVRGAAALPVPGALTGPALLAAIQEHQQMLVAGGANNNRALLQVQAAILSGSRSFDPLHPQPDSQRSSTMGWHGGGGAPAAAAAAAGGGQVQLLQHQMRVHGLEAAEARLQQRLFRGVRTGPRRQLSCGAMGPARSRTHATGLGLASADQLRPLERTPTGSLLKGRGSQGAAGDEGTAGADAGAGAGTDVDHTIRPVYSSPQVQLPPEMQLGQPSDGAEALDALAEDACGHDDSTGSTGLADGAGHGQQQHQQQQQQRHPAAEQALALAPQPASHHQRAAAPEQGVPRRAQVTRRPSDVPVGSSGMRRSSALFIVGSDDQPMLLKYRTPSAPAASHAFPNGPLHQANPTLLASADITGTNDGTSVPGSPAGRASKARRTSAASSGMNLLHSPSSLGLLSHAVHGRGSVDDGVNSSGAGTMPGHDAGQLPQPTTPRTSNGQMHSNTILPQRGSRGGPTRRNTLRELLVANGSNHNSLVSGGAGLLSGSSDRGSRGDTDAADAVRSGQPSVMAECFKITQQVPAGEGVGVAGVLAGPSITMIKYTNLKAQAAGLEAEEGVVEEDEAVVPTNTTLIPTVPVEVVIWSLGSFRLKGVTELMKVVQVLPASLEKRVDHLPKSVLNRGKARCIQRNVARMGRITIRLPDVTKLSCCSFGMGGDMAGASGTAAANAGAAGAGNPFARATYITAVTGVDADAAPAIIIPAARVTGVQDPVLPAGFESEHASTSHAAISTASLLRGQQAAQQQQQQQQQPGYPLGASVYEFGSQGGASVSSPFASGACALPPSKVVGLSKGTPLVQRSKPSFSGVEGLVDSEGLAPISEAITPTGNSFTSMAKPASQAMLQLNGAAYGLSSAAQQALHQALAAAGASTSSAQKLSRPSTRLADSSTHNSSSNPTGAHAQPEAARAEGSNDPSLHRPLVRLRPPMLWIPGADGSQVGSTGGSAGMQAGVVGSASADTAALGPLTTGSSRGHGDSPAHAAAGHARGLRSNGASSALSGIQTGAHPTPGANHSDVRGGASDVVLPAVPQQQHQAAYASVSLVPYQQHPDGRHEESLVMRVGSGESHALMAVASALRDPSSLSQHQHLDPMAARNIDVFFRSVATTGGGALAPPNDPPSPPNLQEPGMDVSRLSDFSMQSSGQNSLFSSIPKDEAVAAATALLRGAGVLPPEAAVAAAAGGVQAEEAPVEARDLGEQRPGMQLVNGVASSRRPVKANPAAGARQPLQAPHIISGTGLVPVSPGVPIPIPGGQRSAPGSGGPKGHQPHHHQHHYHQHQHHQPEHSGSAGPVLTAAARAMSSYPRANSGARAVTPAAAVLVQHAVGSVPAASAMGGEDGLGGSHWNRHLDSFPTFASRVRSSDSSMHTSSGPPISLSGTATLPIVPSMHNSAAMRTSDITIAPSLLSGCSSLAGVNRAAALARGSMDNALLSFQVQSDNHDLSQSASDLLKYFSRPKSQQGQGEIELGPAPMTASQRRAALIEAYGGPGSEEEVGDHSSQAPGPQQ